MALKEFSTEELYFILDVNHAKELNNRFGVHRSAKLFKRAPQPPIQKINRISRSVFSAITEGPSCSMVILWSILGLVSLNLVAISMLTVVFAALLIATGAMFFYATYNELCRDNKRAIKNARLAEVKLLCANEVFRRQRRELKKQNLPQVYLSTQLFAYNNKKPLKNLLPHLKKSLGAALMITPMLFGTYYFAMSGVLAAFGLTVVAGFMTGPIGIGLAIAGSLAIGVYFGVKLYQACKEEEIFDKRLKKTAHQFEYRRRICYEQRSKLAHVDKLDNKLDEISPKRRRKSPCSIRYTRLPVLLVNKSPGARKKLLMANEIPNRLGFPI